jgi:hypothetical protein
MAGHAQPIGGIKKEGRFFWPVSAMHFEDVQSRGPVPLLGGFGGGVVPKGGGYGHPAQRGWPLYMARRCVEVMLTLSKSSCCDIDIIA